MAKKEGVDIRTYRIIYEAIDAVKKAMEGMLEPETKENILSTIEVRQVFKVAKAGTIAGCFVLSGTVKNGSKARVIRDDVEIADTKLSSLRRHKEDVREVQTGFECGLTIDNFNDFKEQDRIETYEEVQVARKLSL
jgi:translation initiation factor IF-2